MRLSFLERLLLKKILRGYQSDNTAEVEQIKAIYDKVEIGPSDRKKFEILERPDEFIIGLERDTDIVFSTEELELLRMLHGLLEANRKINLDNLSLCIKIRDSKSKELV